MARENPSWGDTRLRGALQSLGLDLGRSTIQRILKEHGIEPAPFRGRTMSWRTFLKAHWGAIAAADLGLGNVVPFPAAAPATLVGRIGRRERLGGLLKSYARKAA